MPPPNPTAKTLRQNLIGAFHNKIDGVLCVCDFLSKYRLSGLRRTKQDDPRLALKSILNRFSM